MYNIVFPSWSFSEWVPATLEWNQSWKAGRYEHVWVEMKSVCSSRKLSLAGKLWFPAPEPFTDSCLMFFGMGQQHCGAQKCMELGVWKATLRSCLGSQLRTWPWAWPSISIGLPCLLVGSVRAPHSGPTNWKRSAVPCIQSFCLCVHWLPMCLAALFQNVVSRHQEKPQAFLSGRDLEEKLPSWC